MIQFTVSRDLFSSNLYLNYKDPFSGRQHSVLTKPNNADNAMFTISRDIVQAQLAAMLKARIEAYKYAERSSMNVLQAFDRLRSAIPYLQHTSSIEALFDAFFVHLLPDLMLIHPKPDSRYFANFDEQKRIIMSIISTLYLSKKLAKKTPDLAK